MPSASAGGFRLSMSAASDTTGMLFGGIAANTEDTRTGGLAERAAKFL